MQLIMINYDPASNLCNLKGASYVKVAGVLDVFGVSITASSILFSTPLHTSNGIKTFCTAPKSRYLLCLLFGSAM